MKKMISIYLLCVLISSSYSNIHSMKRSVDSQEEQNTAAPNFSFLSLISDVMIKIVGVSDARNALARTCKALKGLASFDQWKVILSHGGMLSPRDQERIGALLLDEDNVLLMACLIEKYPEYLERADFALDKPLSFARSENMKKLLLKAISENSEKPQDRAGSVEENKQGSLAADIRGFIENGKDEVLSISGIDSSWLNNFYRAVLKGDRNAVSKALQSKEFTTLCSLPMECEIGVYSRSKWYIWEMADYALKVTAVYGYYDIANLLLEHSFLIQVRNDLSISGSVLHAALGRLYFDKGKRSHEIYAVHEAVAQLLIESNNISDLYECLGNTIKTGNPVMVKTLLEALVKTSDGLQDINEEERMNYIALAQAMENQEIIAILKEYFGDIS